MIRVPDVTLVLAALLPQAASVGAADATTAKIEAIRAKAKLPALGGAIVTDGADADSDDFLEGLWVTGERAAGSGVAVEAGDPWHLGSCTKSMTATLIALLVERGDLAWEMTLPELLPDLESAIHAGYRDVTLVELLSHRAGVPGDLSRDGLWDRCWERKGSPTEQRRMLAVTLLPWGPVHAPGTAYLYSNAGVSIAGHVAESVVGKPYEQLMQELLFAPLGITTAGFGAPGTAAKDATGATPETVDAPRGHGGDGKPIEPGPQADNPPAIAPGGTCHMSLADWGRYVRLHLRGAKGDVKVGAITLHAATMKKLHTPYDGAGDAYAMGWMVGKRGWGGGDGTVLSHSGSNTMWFSVCWLAPNAGFAVLVTTNQVGTTGPGAVDEVASALIQQHLARANGKAQEKPKPRIR